MSRPRTYVALLRGINVGGRNRVGMAELRPVLEKRGLEEVTTYIQSGNVVFRATAGAKTLGRRIEDAVEEAFGLRPAVILRTPVELAAVASSCPFADTSGVHVVFLESTPDPAAAAALDLDRSPPDTCALLERELYFHLPHGAGRTKLTLDYVERVLGVRGTQRNWKTVLKLLELARG
jgi:uncharacterized protein (DUF1697 family)